MLVVTHPDGPRREKYMTRYVILVRVRKACPGKYYLVRVPFSSTMQEGVLQYEAHQHPQVNNADDLGKQQKPGKGVVGKSIEKQMKSTRGRAHPGNLKPQEKSTCEGSRSGTSIKTGPQQWSPQVTQHKRYRKPSTHQRSLAGSLMTLPQQFRSPAITRHISKHQSGVVPIEKNPTRKRERDWQWQQRPHAKSHEIASKQNPRSSSKYKPRTCTLDLTQRSKGVLIRPLHSTSHIHSPAQAGKRLAWEPPQRVS